MVGSQKSLKGLSRIEQARKYQLDVLERQKAKILKLSLKQDREDTYGGAPYERSFLLISKEMEEDVRNIFGS